MPRKESIQLFSLILLAVSCTALSVRFNLRSGHNNCILKDFKANSTIAGKYSIVNPNEGHPLPDSHRISIWVTMEYSDIYHRAERVEIDQFAFATPEYGNYGASFSAIRHEPEVTVSVDFEWKSVDLEKVVDAINSKGVKDQ